MSDRPLPNPSVLIVDDEPRMRELLLDFCPDVGLSPVAARSGEEALRLVQQSPPDLLIVDLNLPQMSGLDVLERVRADHPDLPAIVLTGFGDLPAAQRAIRLNVVEFLTKPCDLGQLEQALGRAKRALVRRESSSPVEPAGPSAATLAESEYRQIISALRDHDGNKTAAATQLGISRRTLYYRLERYQSLGYPVE